MGYHKFNISRKAFVKYESRNRSNLLRLPLFATTILLSFTLNAAYFDPNKPITDDTQIEIANPDSSTSLLEFEKNVDLFGEFQSPDGFNNQAAELVRKGLENLRSGNKAKGLKLLKQAWELDQSFVEIAVKIALIYIQDGQFNEAVDYIRQIQTLAPEDPLGYKLGGLVYSGLGDQAKSKVDFEKALKLQPGTPDASLGLVTLALNQKKIDEAIKILENSLAYFPDNQRTLLLLAQLEVQTNKNEQAIIHLKKAISSDSEAYLPRLFLIKILLSRGETQKALDNTNNAINSFPKDIALQELKGLALLKKRSSREALDIFKNLEKTAPNQITVYYNLALAYEQLKQYQNALNALDRGLKIDAHNIPSKFLKAKLLAKTGKLRLAAQKLQELNQAAPDNTETLQLLAKIALKQNEISDSVSYYEKALKIKASNILTTEYAYALMRANQLPKSYQVLETWVKNNPADIFVKNSLADLYLAKNQKDRAQKLYSDILRTQPQNAGVHNNLAWILSSKGLNNKALIHARKALELSPNNPLIMDTNASILLASGEPKKAMVLINAALEKSPDNPLLHFHQAKVLVKTGDTRQAQQVLEKIIQTGYFKEINQAKELLEELKLNL